MDKDHLAQLLNKDAWTREDKQWLLTYIESTDGRELEALLQQQFGDTDAAAPDSARSRLLLQSIHEKIGVNKKPVLRLRKWRMVIAASVIGLLILTTYYLVNKGNKKKWFKKAYPAGNIKAMCSREPIKQS